MTTRKLNILYEVVQYDSTPQILSLSWFKYRKLKKQSKGKGIICRPATIEERKEIQREKANAWYVDAIAKKYNVSNDWQNNRWFVEQVRPTL